MSAREALRDAFVATLASIDLAADVDRALRGAAPFARAIAIGKAAPAMARGALAHVLERILVVAPDGTPCTIDDPRVEIARAAHPIPDARSVEAATRALDLARGSPSTLVLLSGGASALACAPYDDVGLATKQAITRALLASGASIQEVNTVRRHLSRIKGGGLARAAAPGALLTLIVGDVIAGALADVGSGPTVADPTTVDDARAVLAARAPAFADVPLHETAKATAGEARVIASPETFAEALARSLSDRHRVRVLPPSCAPVDALVEEYAAIAASLAPGEAAVRAAEPSLVVPNGAGRGGRCAHLAARVAERLGDGVAFLAGATDGADGASVAAGAAVDASIFAGRDAERAAAIAAFDTATLHAACGTAIVTGPTGLNFTDVHAIARGA